MADLTTDGSAHMREAIRTAYAEGADAWAEGPEAVYQVLAGALLAATPVPLSGRRVLDLGAGTGVASRVLARHGAVPIGYDLAWDMLAQRHGSRPPGVVGDAFALPFATGTLDGVAAACCFNHFEPEVPLRECRRVLRDGGFVIGSTFPADRPHPVKAILEPLLESHGWTPPAWYATFRTQVAAVTGDPDAMAAFARRAGFDEVTSAIVDVDAGLDDADRLLAWRLSMPHTIGFVHGLDRSAREHLLSDARAALAGTAMPRQIALLILCGRT